MPYSRTEHSGDRFNMSSFISNGEFRYSGVSEIGHTGILHLTVHTRRQLNGITVIFMIKTSIPIFSNFSQQKMDSLLYCQKVMKAVMLQRNDYPIISSTCEDTCYPLLPITSENWTYYHLHSFVMLSDYKFVGFQAFFTTNMQETLTSYKQS